MNGDQPRDQSAPQPQAAPQVNEVLQVPHDAVLTAPASAQVVASQPQAPTAPAPVTAAPQAPAPAVTVPTIGADEHPSPAISQPASQPPAVSPADQYPIDQGQQLPVEQLPPASQQGFYRAEAPAIAGADQPSSITTPLQWTAGLNSIHHRKPVSWYLLLVLGAALIATVVYFVSKDVISTVIVALAIPMFGAMSVHRPPRPVTYGIDGRGLTIGNKFYAFRQFRSFSVIEDSFGQGVLLAPLQRFMPFLNVRFDPEHAEQVIDALADHLPMEEHKADAMDRIARSIRL